MNISKISRSLVVVIFVALIIFVGILDYKLLNLKDSVNSKYTNVEKLVYAAIVVILVSIYIYIKDKLYKKKIKRSIGLIYRYVYISIILILSKFIFVFENDITYSALQLVSFILISYCIGIILKKIIFNVSKSDMLSIFAVFAYSLFPIGNTDMSYMIKTSLYTLVFLSCILLLQVLIDELKQRGIKNKKYIVISCVLGVFVSISILFGVSPFVWAIFGIGSMFLSYNLDNTHINFPKVMMSKLGQKKKEFLYKIERINISKLLISIIVVAIVTFILVFAFKGIFYNLLVEKSNNYYVNDIVKNLDNLNLANIDKNLNFSSAVQFYNNFLSYSKTYYMVLIVYIIFMEILAIVLKRRYDTKSTMMKLFFILFINSIMIFKIDLSLYEPMFTVLLLLIAIVNTSNIYLNREERIKMLVAQKV